MACYVPQGPGDVGVPGEAQDAEGEVAQAGHDMGPVPVRAWERSSPKVTSRTQCSWFSIFQCPRIHAASWAGWAWRAGSEVMA
jgi:hypothetical protein